MASGPITQWQIDGGEKWKQWQIIILGGSKVTTDGDGDCSHEIKRCLLLVRKAMTNLDSILKSRDITLPTEVCVLKAMVFPIVMYRCESCTIRRPRAKELMLLNCGAKRRLLRVPWTARRANQSILKEINPEYSLEDLMLKLKLQYFGYLMLRADSLEKTVMLGKIEGIRRRGWKRMRWWIASLANGHEFEQTLEDSDGQAGILQSMGHKESDTT